MPNLLATRQCFVGHQSPPLLSTRAQHKPPVQLLAGDRGPHRVQWRWLAARIGRLLFRRLFRLDAAHFGCDTSIIVDDRHHAALWLGWSPSVNSGEDAGQYGEDSLGR